MRLNLVPLQVNERLLSMAAWMDHPVHVTCCKGSGTVVVLQWLQSGNAEAEICVLLIFDLLYGEVIVTTPPARFKLHS